MKCGRPVLIFGQEVDFAVQELFNHGDVASERSVMQARRFVLHVVSSSSLSRRIVVGDVMYLDQ